MTQPPPYLGTPAEEFRIDPPLVRRLLRQQHPDLAGLPLQPVDTGWDNVIFRLGDTLALRLPRRAVAAALIEHEQRWLPRIAAPLPLPIPVPLRTGAPGCGYPWCWSVLPWFAGAAADQCPPGRDQARPFGAFLRALHVAAPADAPRNPYRGVPLVQRADMLEPRWARLTRDTTLITPRHRQLWQDALAAPVDVAASWIHGDLHARNVLVEAGRIRAVIDWGDLAAGDRATDLAALWMLFGDAAARRTAMRSCGDVSDATWLRAKGWALLFGVLLADTGRVDHPRHARIGAATLRRLGTSD